MFDRKKILLSSETHRSRKKEKRKEEFWGKNNQKVETGIGQLRAPIFENV